MDAAITAVCAELSGVSKLGEGTYGEAFRCGRSVVKVLPFSAAGSADPAHSSLSAAEIWTEIAIMQELNQLRDGASPPRGCVPDNACCCSQCVKVCNRLLGSAQPCSDGEVARSGSRLMAQNPSL